MKNEDAGDQKCHIEGECHMTCRFFEKCHIATCNVALLGAIRGVFVPSVGVVGFEIILRYWSLLEMPTTSGDVYDEKSMSIVLDFWHQHVHT